MPTTPYQTRPNRAGIYDAAETRSLTGARPINPTSGARPSAWPPNAGRRSTYRSRIMSTGPSHSGLPAQTALHCRQAYWPTEMSHTAINTPALLSVDRLIPMTYVPVITRRISHRRRSAKFCHCLGSQAGVRRGFAGRGFAGLRDFSIEYRLRCGRCWQADGDSVIALSCGNVHEQQCSVAEHSTKARL